ncbi:hypothetical protein BDZ89DRAFT_1139859 [Hymenopellis radicata]|nr:hypothetical protein BDZ89DRAFT_1139859 [Hymenopellis radicata]
MSLDSDDDADLAHRAMIVAWVGAGCMTCLVYDHLITLDQECCHIWPARFTIGRILFFINRYVVEGMLLYASLTMTSAPSTHTCCTLASLLWPRHSAILLLQSPTRNFSYKTYYFSCVFYLRWLDINLVVQITTVQGILVLRVWALYRTNKLVIWSVLALYVAGSFTMIVITILDYVVETVTVEEVIHLPGCYAKSVPSIIAAYWITPAIVESVLFFLVMARGFVWWKHGGSAPTILTFMARDSMMYFAIMFALLIANCCMFYFGPPFLSSLLVNPLSTASCILGSRLLLNLGAAVEPATPSEWAIVSSETRWTRPQHTGDLPSHYVMPFDDEEFDSERCGHL